MFRSLVALAGLLVAGAMPLTACTTETIVSEQVSTELTLVSPGGVGDDFEIVKRFRFSRSPFEARGFEVADGLIAVLDPSGQDLTFLAGLNVYVQKPNGERVQVARGDNFVPGDRFAILRPTYFGDLREFAGEDARLTVVFEVEPNAWFQEFPEEGITLLARANIDILL
jgi:hypothetical protein